MRKRAVHLLEMPAALWKFLRELRVLPRELVIVLGFENVEEGRVHSWIESWGFSSALAAIAELSKLIFVVAGAAETQLFYLPRGSVFRAAAMHF
ncbi:MAG: hypothetical protein GY822_12550 [Deltaproteobacteria bacterium]|nr:hypothetical protein [Deltaproteobacteria bacterium]